MTTENTQSEINVWQSYHVKKSGKMCRMLIYSFIYLFKQYLKRVTQLAVSASLTLWPSTYKKQYIYMYVHIYTNK